MGEWVRLGEIYFVLLGSLLEFLGEKMVLVTLIVARLLLAVHRDHIRNVSIEVKLISHEHL